MNTKVLVRILIKVSLSLLVGGIFYTLWLVIFQLTNSFNSLLIEYVLWLLSPVVTAMGFTVGYKIYEQFKNTKGETIWHILIWALIGCILGALVVYWFDPMLIVFSMLLVGTISMHSEKF